MNFRKLPEILNRLISVINKKSNKEHWEKIYKLNSADKVSWFQNKAVVSLAILNNLAIAKNSAIIDVGGGAGNFIDDVLNDGFTNISVNDLAQSALQKIQTRLAEKAQIINWLCGDITQINLSPNNYLLSVSIKSAVPTRQFTIYRSSHKAKFSNR